MSEQKIYLSSSPYTKHKWWNLTSSAKSTKRIQQDIDNLIEGYLSINEKQQLYNIIATERKNATRNKSEPFDEAEFERILNATGE